MIARLMLVLPAKNKASQPHPDVERCFSKLEHSRRIATRYDKTADSFLGFVLIASIRLWIRHFVHTPSRLDAAR